MRRRCGAAAAACPPSAPTLHPTPYTLHPPLVYVRPATSARPRPPPGCIPFLNGLCTARSGGERVSLGTDRLRLRLCRACMAVESAGGGGQQPACTPSTCTALHCMHALHGSARGSGPAAEAAHDHGQRPRVRQTPLRHAARQQLQRSRMRTARAQGRQRSAQQFFFFSTRCGAAHGHGLPLFGQEAHHHRGSGASSVSAGRMQSASREFSPAAARPVRGGAAPPPAPLRPGRAPRSTAPRRRSRRPSACRRVEPSNESRVRVSSKSTASQGQKPAVGEPEKKKWALHRRRSHAQRSQNPGGACTQECFTSATRKNACFPCLELDEVHHGLGAGAARVRQRSAFHPPRAAASTGRCGCVISYKVCRRRGITCTYTRAQRTYHGFEVHGPREHDAGGERRRALAWGLPRRRPRGPARNGELRCLGRGLSPGAAHRPACRGAPSPT